MGALRHSLKGFASSRLVRRHGLAALQCSAALVVSAPGWTTLAHAWPVVMPRRADPVVEHARGAPQPGRVLPLTVRVLQRSPASRVILRLLRRTGVLPFVPAHGSGRVPGVVEVGWNARSFAAFRTIVPPAESGSVRFVYDPTQQILVVGEPHWKGPAQGSPHEQLAQIIGAFTISSGRIEYPVAAGGMISRSPTGALLTTEKSPNLGRGWNSEVRRDFASFLQALTGLTHTHFPGA